MGARCISIGDWAAIAAIAAMVLGLVSGCSEDAMVASPPAPDGVASQDSAPAGTLDTAATALDAGPAAPDAAAEVQAELAADLPAPPPDVVATEVAAPKDTAVSDAAWLHPPGDRGVCDPCQSSAQCADPTASCVGLGNPAPAAGWFCEQPCAADMSCSAGAHCEQRSTAEGDVVQVCIPDSNVCACSAQAAEADWQTPCFVAALGSDGLVSGKCAGTWACASGGCNAKLPAAEVCNGMDDDCDGKTDESVGSDICDDGNPCTIGEKCTAGVCAAGANMCACNANIDCAGGDPCLGQWVCDKAKVPYKCTTVAGTVPSCANLQPTACKVAACTAKAGGCALSNKADGSLCDADGDPCTVGDSCSAGTCAPGETLACDDGNPCTFDGCSAKGCGHTNTVGACSDNKACTSGDSCKQGTCTGIAKACDDGNPCTVDSCDGSSGQCTASPGGASCDDGNPCTTKDLCANGNCAGADSTSCSDGNPCTDDGCAPNSGCTHSANAAPCEDGNACTQSDSCQKGVCTGGASSCGCQQQADCNAKQLADPCLGALVCNLAASPPKCVPKAGAAAYCASPGPCLVATCTAGTCGSTPQLDGTACSDGNACTGSDACKASTCSGTPIACDDGKPCTVDSCGTDGKGIAACQHQASTGTCSDGNACTVGDTCTAGACVAGAANTCSDGKACTLDSCDPKTGKCLNDTGTLQNKVCSTGAGACGAATCQAGICTLASATACDDGNLCSNDACVPDVGCQHTPNSLSCDDGNPCTLSDTCASSKCAGSKPNACNDSNPCTTDSCAKATGCQHLANTLPCDDGNLCTIGDICGTSACTGTPQKCGDGNPCTSSTCTAGVCSPQVAVPDGTVCSDKDSCVGKGACKAAVCVYPPQNCPNKKGREIVPVAIPDAITPAQTLFDPYGFHEVKLTVAPADWTAYLAAVAKQSQAKTWYPAEVTFDGKPQGQVGIRQFGYGSLFTNPQKPNIRVKFDVYVADQTGPDDVHSLRFKPSGQDPTWLRQLLGPVMVQQMGGYAPRYGWARLWVNGQPFGLYQMLEHVDKHFYKVNFANNDGNEYQRKNSCVGLNCPAGICANIASKYIGDPGAATELVAAATLIKSEPDATWPTKIDAIIDMDSLLAEYAWEAIASDIDTLAAAGQNFTIYVNQLTAKMEFIPTGQDLVMGGYKNGWYDLWKPWGTPCTWCGARIDDGYTRIVNTPALKAKLIEKMQIIHCGLFSTAKFIPMIQAYKKFLWPDLTQDPKGFLTANQINTAYAVLEKYVTDRNAYLDTTIGKCP